MVCRAQHHVPRCPKGSGVTLVFQSSLSKAAKLLTPFTHPSIPRSKPDLSPQQGREKALLPRMLPGGAKWGTGARVHQADGAGGVAQFYQNPPQEALGPPGGDSCWLWEALDLFKLKGKQREGSLGRRGGGGAGGRRGGWCVPWPGCGGGLGGKPCTPPCRGSSLLGPEEARSPVLICTYPYTRSCRCKGSTGGLIGH